MCRPENLEVASKVCQRFEAIDELPSELDVVEQDLDKALQQDIARGTQAMEVYQSWQVIRGRPIRPMEDVVLGCPGLNEKRI